METSLSSSVVGAVEAGQQGFEIRVTGDIDAEHFVGDATVEALDHAAGLRGIGLRFAMDDPVLRAGVFEVVSGETGSPVGQQMGDAEGNAFLAALRKAIALAAFSAS